MQRVTFGVVVLVLLVVFSAGCGKKASETAAEKMIESAMGAQGQNADVTIDSDTVQIKTENGDMSFGEGTKLPDNWPDDVPVYAGLKLLTVIATDEGYSLHGTTSDAQEKVAGYYKEQAEKSGWGEETTMTQPQMVMLSYTKAERELTVMINTQDSETSVSITSASK